jgi:hypothetical protein
MPRKSKSPRSRIEKKSTDPLVCKDRTRFQAKATIEDVEDSRVTSIPGLIPSESIQAYPAQTDKIRHAIRSQISSIINL